MNGYKRLDDVLGHDIPEEKKNPIWVKVGKEFDYSEKRTFANNEGYEPSTIRLWIEQAVSRAMTMCKKYPDFDPENTLEVSVRITPKQV